MPQDMNSGSGGQSPGGISAARSTSDSNQEGSSGLAGQMGDQGSAAMGQVRSGANKLTGKARKQVSRYVEGYKGTITQQIDSVAQAIRQAGDELGGGDQSQASRLAGQAAGGLEGLSRTIHDADIEDVLNSVRRFGRSNPAVFIGGAVLAGIALARFARASSRPQHQSPNGQSWQGRSSSEGQWTGRPDAQRMSQGSHAGPQFGSASGGGGSGNAGSFRPGGAATYGDSGATGGGGLGTAAAAAGVAGGFAAGGFAAGGGSTGGGGRGSSRSAKNTSGAPDSAQGYAGGGMGTDPIQSSTGSGRTTTPSSATDPSVGGAGSGSGMPSSTISTGEGS